MNGDQSALGYPGWRPPSPHSTPTSTKLASNPFQPYPHPDQSPSFFEHAWMTPRPVSGPDAAQTSPFLSRTHAGQYPNTAAGLKRPPPSPAVVSSQPTLPEFSSPPVTMPGQYRQSFPTGSFLEQFNNHGISDDPNMGTMMPPHSTPPTAMRTPPPTRDASSRRKPQQPLYQMSTPSTVISRRIASQGDSWSQGPRDSGPEASPYIFTPLQFSPPDPSQILHNLGPMTAPTGPSSGQGGYFWDPYSPHPSFMQHSFSAVNPDDPFVTHAQQQTPMSAFPHPSPNTSFGVAPRYGYGPSMPEHGLDRPQSARPATTAGYSSFNQPESISFASTGSGVDPSLLWTAPIVRSNLPATGDSATGGASVPVRHPYQNQTEQLVREKKGRGRPRKDASKAPVKTASTTVKKPPRPQIQRSFTDSRAVKPSSKRNSIIAHSSPANLAEFDGLDRLLHTGSPLKRHKSRRESRLSTASSQFSADHRRKSINLVIDDRGNARTEIKYIDERASPHRQPPFNAEVFLDDSTTPSSTGDGDDGDDDAESNGATTYPAARSRPVSMNYAGPGFAQSPATRNAMRYETAEDALRDVIRKRRESRHA